MDEATSGRQRRWELAVLASMYVGYVAFMICRNTLQAASPAMIADPELGLDKEKFGQLMSLHSAGAIAGMLIMGPAADRFGGRATFLTCLTLTALACAAFGLGSGLTFFMVFNFLGQCFKSGGWASMAKLIRAWYPPKRYGRVWSIISTSSRVGTISAGLLIGWLLTRVHWRQAFFISAGIGLAAVVAGWFFMKTRPEDVGLPPPEQGDPADAAEAAEPAAPHPFDELTLGAAGKEMAGSARVWLIFLALALLTVLMDFINFLPLYFQESLKVSPGEAAMAGSIFPAGMFASLVVCGVYYDRVDRGGLVKLHGGLLAGAVGCVLLLWGLPRVGLPAAASAPLSVGLVFVLGASIAPSYYLPMSVFALEFGGRHSGFLIAMIDVFGYAGAMVFNWFGGGVAQRHGWPVFLQGLLGVAVASLVVMTAFLALDARAGRARAAA